MLIEPFGVERWMDLYETRCDYNLAETCVDSLTFGELLDLCGRPDFLDETRPVKLTYGEIPGSIRLRTAISALYETVPPDGILAAHGAIGANALVYSALVGPGDRVVSAWPAYQQHHSLPACLGADVRLLRLAPERGFLPDLGEAARLIVPGTALVALTNPNNPAGSLMDRQTLSAIIDLADRAGARVLCDEVYRGLDQDGEGLTESAADLGERAISTGSMSKAFSLAGLRLGWLATRDREVLERVMTHRDYNTISVSMIDDRLAALALESADRILARSLLITRVNRRILADWVAAQPLIEWSPPRSGTTALLRLLTGEPTWGFCVRLAETASVMLTPGSAFGMEGWLRIGYACDTAVLAKGLELLGGFLAAGRDGG
jgi:aspartate/methionine/tyrosine aminotransferase